MNNETAAFLRYPGGKQRLLKQLLPYLQPLNECNGRFVEPFIGGGAVFFALRPKRAVLSDVNGELIDLYRGIRDHYTHVWKAYCQFPHTKEAYYHIRDADFNDMKLADRAARTLYLNRTCFRGMWRHNADGKFNVGYGGQERRWVIGKTNLREASLALKKARLRQTDFEPVIDKCSSDDTIFCDPPYSPGEREVIRDHYTFSKFSFTDYERLAKALTRATKRSVNWAVTTSSHPDILTLFPDAHIMSLPMGIGRRPGELTTNPGEVLIRNYGK